MNFENMVTFSSGVYYDSVNSRYQVNLPEISVSVSGVTHSQALENAIEVARSQVVDFFANFEFYSGFPEVMAKYPYYSMLSQCASFEEWLTVLNLLDKGTNGTTKNSQTHRSTIRAVNDLKID
jgi:Antitoxin of toxin-antitoxin, RelE / RelB, TA system